MTPFSALQLIVLASIWGASFLFMRIAAPVFGASWLVEIRVGSAALFLFAVALLLRKRLELRRHWRYYLILGALNSALPFLCYGYAAQTLSASLLSILNATAPIWGTLITLLLGDGRPDGRRFLGLALGLGGVALLVGLDGAMVQQGALLAALAGIGAAFSYGLAANYARRNSGASPFANAHGSMWAATLLLLPLLPFDPVQGQPTEGVWAAALALGVLCSGIAYLLYFRLIATVGAPSALTVAYLIPLFGVFWGWLFLSEQPGWHTLAGGASILTGTALVTGFSPARLLRRQPRHV